MDKIYLFLGLARKAGGITCGDIKCEIAIKRAKAKLVIVAQDAADNTKKKFSKLAKEQNIPYEEWGDKYILGQKLGIGLAAVVALVDENFANKTYDMIRQIKPDGGVTDD